PGSRYIKSVFESVDDDTKALVNMNDGEKAVVIERIRYADDVSVSLETLHLPPRFAIMLDEDLNNHSLYECLREKYH
ncbi:UTRA domain-containing protein, partial [Salmonella enterica]|uniref:UTRA domain-containing protein n=1 Tax=Salmonella enterica TaxID=28901 RepID=UPI003F1A76BB